MEERHREAGDHDGRRDRDAAVEQHQPHMQPRAGGAAPPLGQHPGEPAGQHQAEQQQHREIGPDQPDADAGLHAERRAAGEDDERRDAGRHRQHDQREGDRAAEQKICEPGRPGPLRLGRGNGQPGIGRPGIRRRRGGDQRRTGRLLGHISPRTTGISRSRIFLRRVLRFSPSIAAALIWLPRVAARVRRISGRSTSAITRS